LLALDAVVGLACRAARVRQSFGQDVEETELGAVWQREHPPKQRFH
jgi:hypothetical protein